METVSRESDDRESLSATPFAWRPFVLWIAAAPLLGGIAAWASTIVQIRFAPLLIFPMIIGVGLGAMLVALMRIAQIGHRPTLWFGAVLAAMTTVIGQHYVSYRDAVAHRSRQDIEALEKAAVFAPDLVKDHEVTFANYMRFQATQGRPILAGLKLTGAAVWTSWAVDGLLVLAAALGVMQPAVKQPFCARCRTWYRTVRSGRIPASIGNRLAEAAGIPANKTYRTARYRLSNCMAGCGPTRFEFSCDDGGGRTFLTTAWLDAAHRDQVGRILDEPS